MKILVLEDHPFQSNFLIKMLHSINYLDIVKAMTGQQALDAINQQVFDIIICDLNLPDIDGMAVLRHLANKQFSGGIILSSAQKPAIINTVTHMVKAQGLNLLGAIKKPMTSIELKKMLESYNCSLKTMKNIDFSPTLLDIGHGLQQGQFINYYQPKVCFIDGTMKGVEVLVRWAHPIHGILSPVYFIDLIENSSLANDLLLAVTTMAIKDYCQWSEYKWQGTLSINVSEVNLNNDDICNQLFELTKMSQISSNKIIFELTERVAIQNMEKVLEVMARLSMRGFGLSIDDFGTGFSSLQQLEAFPFTELKLDRSFVNTCLSNQTSNAIIDFSIYLARRLKLDLVFEGIEDKETWEYLKKFEYGTCQGYFSARPMPAEQLMDWYDNWIKDFPTL